MSSFQQFCKATSREAGKETAEGISARFNIVNIKALNGEYIFNPDGHDYRAFI